MFVCMLLQQVPSLDLSENLSELGTYATADLNGTSVHAPRPTAETTATARRNRSCRVTQDTASSSSASQSRSHSRHRAGGGAGRSRDRSKD